MLRFLPLVLALLALLSIGLSPDPIPKSFPYQDKLHHLAGFSVLALTLRLAFPQLKLVWFLGLGIGTAVAIEAVQFFMSDRDASPGDMMANVAGIVLGWLTSRWIRRRWRPAAPGDV